MIWSKQQNAMKIHQHIWFILCFSLTTVSAQNETHIKLNDSLVKTYVNINDIQYNAIKKKAGVMKELHLAIKDSVQSSALNRRLRLFFENKYNEKQLIITLKMERHMKGSNGTFELDYSIDADKSLSFDSVEAFLSYEKKRDSLIFGNPTVVDSIIKKKNKE